MTETICGHHHCTIVPWFYSHVQLHPCMTDCAGEHECWVLELGHTTPLARSVESRPHLLEQLGNFELAFFNSVVKSFLLILRQSR